MHQTPERCPKCDGQMEQGFILDMTYGGRVVSKWAAGAPIKSVWSGTKLPEEKLIPVGAFRCASCGYLESYARDEFAAQ
jgi:predicted nucleic-acid-binding Zn-ribbon protein